MQAHAGALFTLDLNAGLVCVNEPAGDLAPPFFLGMTSAGSLVRVRADVDHATRDELTHMAASIEPVPDVLTRALDPSPSLVILARSRPIQMDGGCAAASANDRAGS